MRPPLRIAGGSYVDARPTGEYAALVLGARVMRTHLSDLPLPLGGINPPLPSSVTDWPLYHDISPAGPVQIAGQAAGQGGVEGAWHWHSGRWHFDTRIAQGTNAVAFDLAGTLHVIEPGPHVTSQGFRYVDRQTGRLVLGDETRARDGLAEYTELGDGIRIGQGWPEGGGPPGGCVVQIDGTFRVLEPGDCRFIKPDRIGDQFSVPMVKPGESVIYWPTLADLRALPVWQPPQPPPDDDRKEPPVDSKPDLPNYLHLIEPLWATHGGPTEAAAVRFLRAAVPELRKRDSRCGFFQKATDWGHDPDKVCFLLPTGLGFVDIVGAAGSPSAKPAWQYVHFTPGEGAAVGNGTGWIAALPGQAPEPVEPPPPTGLVEALARIGALEATVRRLEAALAQPVSLRSAHGHYFCAEPDGRVVADRNERRSWEVFDVERGPR